MRIVTESVPEVELTRQGFVTTYPPHRRWRPQAVASLPGREPLNVYVHLPYCMQRCAYCFYKTIPAAASGRRGIDRYVAALCREIRIAARRFHLEERPTVSVYFGGGTPTLLSAGHLRRVMETLRSHLSFAEPEIVMETEPLTLTRRKASLLGSLGVNRISVGIQSFCDDVLSRTGRPDSEAKSLESVARAKGTGAVVNVDLLSGLAGETLETWAYSLDRALAADVHALTVYKMELYANTGYFAGVRHGSLELPSHEEELRLMRYAMERFAEAGYRPVNFFTFTRDPRHAQRHITNWWRGEDLCAFGVSAFGSFGRWNYQNTSDENHYVAALEAGKLPLLRGYVLSDLDRMVRDVLLGMKLLSIDLEDFTRKHGVDLRCVCAPALEKLWQEGFVDVGEEKVSMTSKGVLYGDYAGKVLAACLQELGAASATRAAS